MAHFLPYLVNKGTRGTNFRSYNTMLKNYLITSLRNLRRNKLFSFINITGLSICIAVSILLFIWIKDELSYDRFYVKSDQIYRLGWDVYGHDEEFKGALTAFPVGPAITDLYPEIHNYVRFRHAQYVFSYNEKTFTEDNVFIVDQSIFNIFNFELIRGNPETALTEPRSVVMTEQTARKYFGEENPLGKTILSIGQYEFIVTGVLQNIPSNSHIQFDMLVSYSTVSPETYQAWTQNWFDGGFYTYLLIDQNVNITELENKLEGFYDEYVVKGEEIGYRLSFGLEPLTWIYLNSTRFGQIGPTGNPANVVIFIAITFLIILLACVNYVLISTVIATKRTKEISIRKVLGSDRKAIRNQFIFESVMISILSSFIALSLAELGLPLFNALANKNYSSIFSQMDNLIIAIPLFAIIIGITAGFYPSVYISRMLPIHILKMHSPVQKGKLSLRKALVVLQFIISAGIIISSIIIYQQLGYIKNKELGFKTDSLLVIDTGMERYPEVTNSYNAIKQDFLNRHDVSGVTVSAGMLGGSTQTSGREFQTQAGGTREMVLSIYSVDYDFIDIYNIPLTAGRWFSPDHPADLDQKIVVNETTARRLGYLSPETIVGQKWGDDLSGEIIGVVKDFHFKPLHHPVEPMVFLLIDREFSNLQYITIAYNTNDISRLVSDIERIWNENISYPPFTYFFYDDYLYDLYGDDHLFAQIFTVSSFLAIFIACIGLFGLVSFTVEQRKKEISIRKVLGSSISGIFMLLSKEYVLLVTVSILIASPVAYYFMTKWLENFAYRTSIGIGIFLLAMAAILLIAILTVGYQSVRAAFTNPVEALKYE